MILKKINFGIMSTAAIAAVLSLSACHVDDRNDDETTVTAEEHTTIHEEHGATMADTTVSITDSQIDTSMMPLPVTGLAKPNPAKKGMKGKTIIVSPTAAAMKGEKKPDAAGVYPNVDRIPAFAGGNAGLQKFFDDNIQYPETAQDQGVEGTVRVVFTVDENGKLMAPIIEGQKQGYGLDEEALRVINKMPVWSPGTMKGKAVKTRFVLPVRFALN